MIDEQANIVVYTRRSCGYCRAAKSLLASNGLRFTEVDVTSDPEKRGAMVARSQQRTVPQIFIDGKPVGGFTDLAALLKRAG